MNSIYTMNSKYYNSSKCYKSNENYHTDNNTCLNFICASLEKNKLLELNMNKYQEILNKHDNDIDVLKKEIMELKKKLN
jgi:hypothetical protein